MGRLTFCASGTMAASEKVPRAGVQTPAAEVGVRPQAGLWTALTKAKQLLDGNACGPLWTLSNLNQT